MVHLRPLPLGDEVKLGRSIAASPRGATAVLGLRPERGCLVSCGARACRPAKTSARILFRAVEQQGPAGRRRSFSMASTASVTHRLHGVGADTGAPPRAISLAATALVFKVPHGRFTLCPFWRGDLIDA
jgi:hypothetical protein